MGMDALAWPSATPSISCLNRTGGRPVQANVGMCGTTSDVSLMSLVAHEMRAPLAVFKGYLEMLRDGSLSVSEREQAARAMQVKAEELESLADTLMTAVQMDSAEIALRPIAFAVAEAIDEAVGRLAPRARLEGAVVDVVPPAEPAWVVADPGHVVCILSNVLAKRPDIHPRRRCPGERADQAGCPGRGSGTRSGNGDRAGSAGAHLRSLHPIRREWQRLGSGPRALDQPEAGRVKRGIPRAGGEHPRAGLCLRPSAAARRRVGVAPRFGIGYRPRKSWPGGERR